MYDHPHDPSIPGMRSVKVGDSFPVRAAVKAVGLVSKGEKLLDDLIPIL